MSQHTSRILRTIEEGLEAAGPVLRDALDWPDLPSTADDLAALERVEEKLRDFQHRLWEAEHRLDVARLRAQTSKRQRREAAVVPDVGGRDIPATLRTLGMPSSAALYGRGRP